MAEEKNINTEDIEVSGENNEANDSCDIPETDSGKKNKKESKADAKKMKAELDETKKKLEEETKRADEINDKYLRIVAEYDNFRKRSQNERAQVYGDAVADTLAGLLPIIDNLQYASKYSGGDAEKVAEGLNLILSKLPETLEKLSITAFGEAGETFDPNLHNAILHEENDELGEGVITDVLQCGYKYKEKVIRYAMVKVAN
ncbi:MAG: nucleotide exchange factor GrpE [Ruminococcaceae bacterium]|nr:nucleotide exchange factor GrpE [Oscillospiraceae bacterium]